MQPMTGAKKEFGGARQGNGQRYVSFIAKEYGRGYEIPAIPYQQRGILARELWPSRNQVLRIVPGYNEETGEVFPQNIKTHEYAIDGDMREYISDTFTECTIMANFCGNSLVVADYKPGTEAAENYGADTVLRCFSSSIYNSVKALRDGKRVVCPGIDDWKIWVAPQGILPLPRRAFLMQVLAFTINGRNNTEVAADPNGAQQDLVDENGSPLPLAMVVALTQKESVKYLLQALVEPNNPGLPLDAINNNKYGGLAEANGNLLFLNSVTTADGKHYLKPSVQGGGRGWTPTPFPLDEEQIKQLFVPWLKVLNFLTPEEQLELLANNFGADTVNYVSGLDPRLAGIKIPDHIWQAGFGRYENLVTADKSAARCAAQGATRKATAPKTASFALGANSPFDASKLNTKTFAQPKPVDTSFAEVTYGRLGGGRLTTPPAQPTAPVTIQPNKQPSMVPVNPGTIAAEVERLRQSGVGVVAEEEEPALMDELLSAEGLEDELSGLDVNDSIQY